MSYSRRQSLTSNKLIVCEGGSDVAFFEAFIKARNIPGPFCVRCTEDAGGAPGIDGFEAFLDTMPGWTDAHKLQHIILVADGDTNSKANFQKVRAQIRRASPDVTPVFDYGVPEQVGRKARGSPATMTVLMIPRHGEPGCLETLCLRAAAGASNKAGDVLKCVEQFAKCTGSDRWSSVTKRAKMQMTAFVAGAHQRRPEIPLTQIWKRPESARVIPLDAPCFDDIEKFLLRY